MAVEGKQVLENNKKYSILLMVLLPVAIMTCRIYQNVIFLSKYDASFLPYFLFVGMIINAFFYAIILRYFKNNVQIKARYLFLILLGMLIVLNYMTEFANLYYAPFIYALILNLVDSIMFVLIWRLINSSFDVLSFKESSKNLSILNTGSSAIIGIILMLLIEKSGTQVIPYIIFAGILSIVLLLHKLQIFEENSHVRKHQDSSNSKFYTDELFIRVLFYSTIVVIIFMNIEFLFKGALTLSYSKEKIAYITALTITIYNIISVAMQYFGINALTNRFGITGLFSVLPTFLVVFGLAMLIAPSFGMICVLYAGKSTFYYSFNRIAEQMIFSAYNEERKFSAIVYIKVVADIIGGIIAFVGLLYLGQKNHAYIFSLIVASGVVCYAAIYNLPKLYKLTIQKNVELNRYDSFEDLFQHKEVVDFCEIIINEDLKSSDSKKVISALQLILKMKYQLLSDIIYKHLSSSNPEIRYYVAEILFLQNDKRSLEKVIVQLDQEQEIDIFWLLFEVVYHIHPFLALAIARKYYYLGDHTFKFFLLRIYLKEGDIDELCFALTELKNLMQDANYVNRYQAVKVLRSVPIGNMGKFFTNFLHDENEKIRIEAVYAILKQKRSKLIPEMIKSADSPKLRAIIIKGLMKFEDKSLQYMKRALENCNFRDVVYLFKLLTAIPGEEAEKYIMQFDSSKSMWYRTVVARECAYRAAKMYVSKDFKKFALDRSKEEINLIYDYYVNLMQEVKHLNREEIKQRIAYAQNRIIFWICVFTKSDPILRVSPKLLFQTKNNFSSYDYAKAVELVSTYIKFDRELESKFIQAFTNNIKHPTYTKTIEMIDPSLHSVLIEMNKAYRGEISTMNTTLIAFVLRNSEIFNSFPPEILIEIANDLEVLEYDAGYVVFEENAESDGMYIVVTGNVELYKGTKLIKPVAEYEVFGEVTMLDKSVRDMRAVCKSKTTLLFIDSVFFDLIASDIPELYRAVTKKAIQDLRSLA